MEQSFKARYYDGVSSNPYTVDIRIHDQVLFQYTDSQGRFIQESWAKAHFRLVERNSAITALRRETGETWQQLEMTDPELKRLFDQRILGKTAKRGMPVGIKILFILAAFAGLLILAYFTLVPYLADRAAAHFPKDTEISMGKQLYEQNLIGQQVDEARSKQVTAFLKAFLGSDAEYPVQVAVVESAVPNAYAMPGGGMVVYTGILDSMDHYAQLAALLGHEYSHVQLRHSTRNLFRSMAGYLFLSVILGDANGVVNVVVRNADNLRGLRYGRSLETEADQNGLRLMEKKGVPASGMAGLFKKLNAHEQIEINEMFSSHPDMDRRIQEAEQYAQQHPYAEKPNEALKRLFDDIRKPSGW